MSELLSVQDLSISYGRGPLRPGVDPAALIWAARDVSFTMAEGESVAIVGESGSGKSTVARTIVGLLPATLGEIRIDGRPIGRRRTPAQRRAVQLVFQDPYSSLNPRMTVQQAITEALRVHRMRPSSQLAARTRELLDLVQLPERLALVHPRQLSGGQRQRVSIARALATEPRLLVADEPVSALDVSVQAAILNLFADLRAEIGLAVLMISHNLAVVRHVSDRVLVMHEGLVVETGPTERVLAAPEHPYTRGLLASVPSLVPRSRTAPSAPQAGGALRK